MNNYRRTTHSTNQTIKKDKLTTTTAIISKFRYNKKRYHQQLIYIGKKIFSYQYKIHVMDSIAKAVTNIEYCGLSINNIGIWISLNYVNICIYYFNLSSYTIITFWHKWKCCTWNIDIYDTFFNKSIYAYLKYNNLYITFFDSQPWLLLYLCSLVISKHNDRA